LEKAPPLHAATPQQRVVAIAARFWKNGHHNTQLLRWRPSSRRMVDQSARFWKKRYHSADMCRAHSVWHKRFWTDRYHRNNNKRHNRNGGLWEQTAAGTACVWKKAPPRPVPWKKRYHDNARGTRNQLV